MTKSISRKNSANQDVGKKYFRMAYSPVGLFCNVVVLKLISTLLKARILTGISKTLNHLTTF